MKKWMKFVGVSTVAILSLGAVSGCGLFGGSVDDTYHEISSLEELYAMESDKNYQLMCDLDLGEREWFPLSVINFNGNGHTISNGIVNSTSEKSINDVMIGFFKNASVENVVFDAMNFNVTTSGRCVKFGFVTGFGTCTNVRVTNSMALISISDSFTDISYYSVGGISGESIYSLSQCSFSNSTIICNILSSVGSGYIGGVVGRCTDGVTSCSVNNLKLSLNGQDGELSFGGIIGASSSHEISACIVEECEATITTKSSSATRAGGIIGYSSEGYSGSISNCLSRNNSIEVQSAHNYSVGGIAGRSSAKISNCLSDSNILSATATAANDKDFCGIAGICAAAYATISKCISQSCTISGTSTSADQKYATGLVASSEASITYCAVNQNHINGGRIDVFTTSNENIHYCCVNQDSVNYPNTNDVTVLGDNEWENIIDLLKLDPEIWEIDETQHLTIKAN